MIVVPNLQEIINNETNKYAKRFYMLLQEDKYSLVDDTRYISGQKKVKVMCEKGHVYDCRPRIFYEGKRCFKCASIARAKQLAKTTEEFKKEVYNMVSDEYSVLGEYVNNVTRILFVHNTCKHQYMADPGEFISGGSRCPKCLTEKRSKLWLKTQEEFEKDVFNLVGEDYKVLGEYKHSEQEIQMEHVACGFQYYTTPEKFLHFESRCKRCIKKVYSLGELMIQQFLVEYGYDHAHELWFDGCRSDRKRPLPFDFGVHKNSELVALIEYQGQHHYKPVDFAGRGEKWAEEKLKSTQQSDNIKRRYCEDNDIPLIEIHYSLTNDEVREFLCEELAKYF